MNSKIEETLGLPSLKDAIQDSEQEEHDLDKSVEQAQEMQGQLNLSNSNELIDWQSIKEHDDEMNEVSREAMSSYKDLMDLGMSLDPKHSSQAFEPAVNMLKIALDARNSKNDKKLRLMRLQLEKARFEQKVKQEGGKEDEIEGEGMEMDRNKILRLLQEDDSEDK